MIALFAILLQTATFKQKIDFYTENKNGLSRFCTCIHLPSTIQNHYPLFQQENLQQICTEENIQSYYFLSSLPPLPHQNKSFKAFKPILIPRTHTTGLLCNPGKKYLDFIYFALLILPQYSLVSFPAEMDLLYKFCLGFQS